VVIVKPGIEAASSRAVQNAAGSKAESCKVAKNALSDAVTRAVAVQDRSFKPTEAGSSKPRPPLIESNQVSAKGKEKAPMGKFQEKLSINSRASQENLCQTISKKRVTSTRPSSPALSDCSLSSSVHGPPRKRLRKGPRPIPDSPLPCSEVARVPVSSEVLSAPSTSAKPSEPESSGDKRTDEQELEIDEAGKEELRGFLVQTLAMSRVASMPATCILKEVLQDQPQLAAQRSRKAWLKLVKRTLRSSVVFGRIDRNGYDADDKPLECQWFYLPDKDDDRDRAALLKEMMPKKRSETRKHKQYYYRPVAKLSRWDDEDED